MLLLVDYVFVHAVGGAADIVGGVEGDGLGLMLMLVLVLVLPWLLLLMLLLLLLLLLLVLSSLFVFGVLSMFARWCRRIEQQLLYERSRDPHVRAAPRWRSRFHRGGLISLCVKGITPPLLLAAPVAPTATQEAIVNLTIESERLENILSQRGTVGIIQVRHDSRRKRPTTAAQTAGFDDTWEAVKCSFFLPSFHPLRFSLFASFSRHTTRRERLLWCTSCLYERKH